MRRAETCTCALLLLVASSLCSVVHADCGDDFFNAAREECDDGNLDANDGCSPECLVDCTDIDSTSTGHTCHHGTYGPYSTVLATAHPGPAFNSVSDPHTHFTVVLNGALGSNRSVVVFQPNANESYAVFMKENYPLVLRDEGGEPVSVRLEHPIDTCPSLTWVRVFAPLVAGTRYVVDIGPWGETDVSFAFESLGAFGSTYSIDADGDGVSASFVSASSACVPPAPYLAGLGEDCNDEDPSVHPDAAEVCDGVDNDCDESVDDMDCREEDAGEEPTHDASDDAGEEDSATAVHDASIAVDASVEPDAAIATDSSVNDSGLDASVPGGKPSSDGCSCNLIASPTHTSRTGLLHAFGWIALGAWRLRRRRTGRQQ